MPEYRNEKRNIIKKERKKSESNHFNIIEFILVCFIVVLILWNNSISSSKVLYIPKGGTQVILYHT